MALTDKQMRELIKKVRECAPNMSSNDITLILEYFNYNVDQSVASILENGGQEALKQWHQATPKYTTPKTKKKKNKKPPSSSTAAATTTTTAITTTTNLTTSANNNLTNDVTADHYTTTTTTTTKTSVSPVVLNGHVNGVVEDEDEEEEEELVKKQQKMKDAQRHKEDYKHMSKKERDRTMSEISVASTTERSKNPHAGLEKSCKELQRQTTSLQHLKVVLKEQMDKSYKRVNEVFKELRQQMVEREAELMFLLDKSKAKASEVLATYELKAADLKLRTDRAQAMNDKEVAILRSDIKHFVTDHKHYEEVATNPKFTCDFNKMLQSVQQFGEVPPIRGISEYQAHLPANSISCSSPADGSTSDAAAANSADNGLKVHHHHPRHHPHSASVHILNQSESLTKYENQALTNRIAQLSAGEVAVHTAVPSTTSTNFSNFRSSKGRGYRGGGSGPQAGRGGGMKGGRGRAAATGSSGPFQSPRQQASS